MKVGDSVYWGVDRGVGTGVGTGVGDEVDSCVGDEGFEVLELSVGGKVLSINISKMKY